MERCPFSVYLVPVITQKQKPVSPGGRSCPLLPACPLVRAGALQLRWGRATTELLLSQVVLFFCLPAHPVLSPLRRTDTKNRKKQKTNTSLVTIWFSLRHCDAGSLRIQEGPASKYLGTFPGGCPATHPKPQGSLFLQ